MSGSPKPSRTAGVALLAFVLSAACGGGDGDGPPSAGTTARSRTTMQATTTVAPRPPEGSVVVAAAGDIACEPGQAASGTVCQMEATADLVEAARPEVVLTVGDNQYEDGTLEKFKESYEASWGRFKDITRPTVGNHEYGDEGAAGYFSYFGEAAGAKGEGWYSFEVGDWHLVALNSNCSRLDGGCAPGSAQFEWLRADLARSEARCTLAYWHHPRFTSGFHGNDDSVAPLWNLLDAEGAELVVAGHDHHYERLAPLGPDGVPSPAGMRQFIVGTGGRSLFPALLTHAGSEVRRATSYGVLLLTLEPSAYRWRFVATAGDDFTDAGRAECR